MSLKSEFKELKVIPLHLREYFTLNLEKFKMKTFTETYCTVSFKERSWISKYWSRFSVSNTRANFEESEKYQLIHALFTAFDPDAVAENFKAEETNTRKLVNTDELAAEERKEMCDNAVRIINERTEDGTIKLHPGQTGEMKSYAVDLLSNCQPKLTKAFQCPTKPLIYLQVRELRPEKHIVDIFVRQSDIKSVVLCADGMCYDVKLVEKIVRGNYTVCLRCLCTEEKLY